MMLATDETLAAVRRLTPAIVARSEDVERQRRLPLDLVDELTRAGCFRMLVPSSHGGDELDLPTQLQVLEELARADGSVAWTVMIGSLAPLPLAKLARATFDALYADGPDVILAGAFNPTGVATPTPGGFKVSGQWSFASGCQHCRWFIAHCVVDDGRVPPVRMMLLRPDQVAIKDTWTVSGMCGTGSHDFVVDDVFVEERHTFSLFEESCIDGPLFHIPELSFSTFSIASVAVGIAGGALGEIMTMASDKVPAFADGALAANPLFHYQLGEADSRLRAARALLHADAAAAWAIAESRAPFAPELRARIRGTNTWVVQMAAAIVDMAYTAGGGTAMHSSSPLQRRLRDIHALTQHFGVKPDTYTKAGAVLAGQDVDLTFL